MFRTGCSGTQPFESALSSRPITYQNRTCSRGSVTPRNGGKRSTSATFESAPSMFDWPAKTKTRISSSPADAVVASIERNRSGRNRRCRGFMRRA